MKNTQEKKKRSRGRPVDPDRLNVRSDIITFRATPRLRKEIDNTSKRFGICNSRLIVLALKNLFDGIKGKKFN